MNKDIIAIVCPDVHGRLFWKDVIKDYDGSIPFIFLGDYLDPYPNEGITPEESKNTFNEIWDFKKKWDDNVIMLLGNHDMSYYDSLFRCCRFSYSNYEWYKVFLKENWEHFKITHSINNNGNTIILSHAGIHPYWLRDNNFEEIYDSEYINSLFTQYKSSFNDYSFYRGGYMSSGSPIWADIREFDSLNDNFMPENTIQIVGHTQLMKDMIVSNNVYCIDSRQLFVITNNNEIKKYKEG